MTEKQVYVRKDDPRYECVILFENDRHVFYEFTFISEFKVIGPTPEYKTKELFYDRYIPKVNNIPVTRFFLCYNNKSSTNKFVQTASFTERRYAEDFIKMNKDFYFSDIVEVNTEIKVQE